MKTTTSLLGSLLLAATTAFAQQNTLTAPQQFGAASPETTPFTLLGSTNIENSNTVADFEKNVDDGVFFQLQTNELEADLGSKINTYPNPSNGFFTLSLPENLDVLSIEVYDFTGRLVFVDKGKVYTKPLKREVDLSANSSGSYILVVRTNSHVYNQKLIIQN